MTLRKTDDAELIFEFGLSEQINATPEQVVTRLAVLQQEPQGCLHRMPPTVSFRNLPDEATLAFRINGGAATCKGVIVRLDNGMTQVEARLGIRNLALLMWCAAVAVFIVVLNTALIGRTLVPPLLCGAMIAVPSLSALWLGLLYQRSRLTLLVRRTLYS